MLYLQTQGRRKGKFPWQGNWMEQIWVYFNFRACLFLRSFCVSVSLVSSYRKYLVNWEVSHIFPQPWSPNSLPSLSPSKSVVINYTVKSSTALPLLEPGSDSHYPGLLPDTNSVPAAPTHSWLGIALPGEALQHPILPAKVIGARQGVPSTQKPGTAHATAKRK